MLTGWELFAIAILAVIGSVVLSLLRRNIRSLYYGNSTFEERYQTLQQRRRRLILILMSLSVLGILIGIWIPFRENAFLFIVCWSVVVFLLLWVLVLGIVDYIAVKIYYRSLRDRVSAEEAVVRYQLREELLKDGVIEKDQGS